MTAAAKHDEQFFGECLESGMHEEQEFRCLDPAEIERRGGPRMP
jgi:hypothetical protein